MDNSQNTPQTLGSQSIGRLLVQYSVPAIIASVAVSLYNIIDSMFIGQGVGPMAIAGLAITFPLMNLVIAFCTLIAVGGATISSIFLGQHNYKRATDTVNNVTLACLIHSVIFGGIALIFLDEILIFFGATEATLPYAREFMEVILYGTPISYVFIGLNNLMRATGYPKKAMVSALLSVVVNLILAPIFIFSLDWGIKGAAWATNIAQFASLIWVLVHFLSKKSYVHLNLRDRWFAPSILKRVYAIGLSPFLMNMCGCIVVLFINRALLDYGGDAKDLAVGAYGILNRAGMFFVMIVFGVTQGMQPILGYNYGAKLWPRVKSTLRVGIYIGVAINTIGWAVFELIPDQVNGLFTTHRVLIDIARDGARMYYMFYPLIGAQIIIQNFFQSIGKPNISIFLSLTRQLICLIPMLVLLPPLMGIEGVWMSVAASDFIAFVVTVVTAVIVIKRLNKQFAPCSIPSTSVSHRK